MEAQAGLSGPQPTATWIEAKIIRADGTEEDLGVVAYAHRSRLKTILAQRHVRGGSVLRALFGLGPKIRRT